MIARVFALVILGFSVAAQAGAPDAIEEARTSSGVRVLARARPAIPLQYLTLSVRAGSRLDPPERAGLSCLLAHAIDDAGARGSLSRQLLELGATLEIECSEDAVHFSIATADGRFEAALGILERAILDEAFQPAELDKTRARFVAALQNLEEEPEAIALRRFLSLMFGSGPLGHTPDGVSREIAHATREELLAFRRAHYVRSAITLCAVGPRRAAVIAELAPNAFASLVAQEASQPPTPASQPSPLVPSVGDGHATGSTSVVRRAEMTQRVLFLGHFAISRASTDYPAARIAAMILGGSFTSRLQQNLRERRGYCYHIGARFFSMASAGYFGIEAAVRADALEASLREIDRELERLPESITARELTKAKKLLFAREVEVEDAGEGALAAIARIADGDFAVDFADKQRASIARASLAQVRAAAKRLIRAKSLLRVIVGG